MNTHGGQQDALDRTLSSAFGLCASTHATRSRVTPGEVTMPPLRQPGARAEGVWWPPVGTSQFMTRSRQALRPATVRRALLMPATSTP